MSEKVRIICTRPVAHNRPWAETLTAAGFVAVEAPVMEIVGLSQPQQLQTIKQRILQLDQYQKVIFVSQNAVAFAFDVMDDYWPQLPVAIDWLAVGKSTATLAEKYLNGAGELVAATTAMNSEELLSLPQLRHVESQKILICRGSGGRPKLQEVLQERGAQVHLCELYERRLAKNASFDFAAAHLGADDIVSVFSGETLQFCLPFLQQHLAHTWSQLRLLVPGQRVAQLARKLGFKQIIRAHNATDKAMLAALSMCVER